MSLPSSPTDGDFATETLTNRRYKYVASLNGWIQVRRTDLKELGDVSDTAPLAGEYLVWDSGLSEYIPSDGATSSYVPFIYGSTLPTETDRASTGTVWSYSPGDGTNLAWVATKNDATRTFWERIGSADDPLIRPIIPVSAVAPTNPQIGDIWFDNSSGSVVRKYYDETLSWTILN